MTGEVKFQNSSLFNELGNAMEIDIGTPIGGQKVRPGQTSKAFNGTFNKFKTGGSTAPREWTLVGEGGTFEGKKVKAIGPQDDKIEFVHGTESPVTFEGVLMK